jgi:hypothetical protein
MIGEAAGVGEPADELGGRDAGGSDGADGEAVAALGEARARVGVDEGDVDPVWAGEIEGLLEEGLGTAAGEEVGPAQDLGDALVRVVQDDREVVGHLAVAAGDGEVAEVLVGAEHVFAGEVVVGADGIGGCAEAERRGAAAQGLGLGDRGVLAAAGAGVGVTGFSRVRGGDRCPDLGASADAWVGQPFLE